ncbi:tripartite tricarboxylate transporter substrate-binding protein [Blastococcus capsensis]|uniref:tripartite tricarboxylate transporter substrate-binding protein n=2 Tax=Bacillati TaxID=1783272 RepID=UPI002541F38D|nr:tripartite tricarboxylate transporter substrate-binding protein [Blastococcus capsensis]MDK3255441.1 tripartite tricarboxylate transporter substrate-binding protein [Blastococcus capsensis]
MAAALMATVVGCSSGGDVEATGEGGSPFEGETIDFVVPFDPGGGYDTYTRLIAPYLGECLGAEVVVLNEPGAGSLLATGRTATSAPDGLRIQIMNMPGVLSSQIAEAEGVRFDLSEFSWIGRIAAPPEVVLVQPSGEYQSFEDLMAATEEVQFVATGPGASDYINASVLAQAYGIPFKLTTGFSGSQEATNAVVAGNADVHVMPFDTVLPVITSDQAKAAAVVDDELPEYMTEAPLIGQFPPPGDGGQELLDSLMNLSAAGRAVAAPPGVPEEELTALREGFSCAMENQELLDELAEQERPVNFLGGKETADLVQQVLDSPKEFQEAVKNSF